MRLSALPSARTFSLCVAATLAALSIPSLARAERVIDDFTDPFPATTLPGVPNPVQLLWVGTFAGVSQPVQTASQTNLAGVVGGQRFARLSANTTTLITADVSSHTLNVATGTGRAGVLALEYGAINPLNLNLSGSRGFELDITGDMDNGGSARPVTLAITARSGSTTITRTYSLLRDGVYQFPFTAFTGVNFADLDYLKLNFDASAYQSVDFSLLGGVRTTGCLQSGTPIGDLFIDTFAAALPLRSIPGVGTLPALWVGTSGGVSRTSDFANQSGLAGTLGGQRDSELLIPTAALSNFVIASSSRVGVTPAIAYSTAFGPSGAFTLEYGGQADLNANLSAMRAFELEIEGDMSGGTPRPVPLTITAISGSGAASTTVSLLANGLYTIPFTAFPGVNFADVDFLQFRFNANNVDSIDYVLIGGLRAAACIR